MAIAKMKLINIISYKDKLEDVLLKVLDLDNFHPEAASKMIEKVDTLTSMNEDSPYAETLQKYQEVASVLNIQVSKQHVSDVSLDLDKAKAFVEQAADHAKLIANIKHDLEVVVQENKDVLTTLDHIESSDFSFDDLFSCQYIRCRFGRLPIQCAKQLVQRENSRFAFISFNEDEHYSWCAYLTTIRHEAEVDNIFSSLDFERIHIPSFVHGTPDRAREMITEELANDLKHLDHVDQRMKEYVQGMQDKFVHNYVVLKHLNATYTVRQYVVGLGDQFEISGFVEEKDAPGIVEMFSAIEGVTVENLPVDVDKRLTPPTKLKNNWFVKPFEMFVEMYGLPAYGQMDPTPFVALTYTLLFGIMFGDLGQGLVLMLVGWLASKKFGLRLGDIGVRIGISSAIFGLAYGSFFGDEEILTPFFTEILHMNGKPIEVLDANFTMTLLLATVALGAVLIMISMAINVMTRVRNHDLGEALFSQNGLAGFVFYTAIMVGLALQMLMGISVFNPVYIVLLIVLPLILIFLKEPLTHKLAHEDMFPEGVGGFVVESIFELLEVCLTFVANTMSFLRIGGFVLSHAGMMLVVYVLADMVGTTFSPLVIVLGNIFVMCLEGMIVGIQVLRLEFYEMFSRYFDGGGTEFKSLKVEE
ncbi:MAG TPA: V-type ATP synthase subunit I [Candidatus Fimiplasma intestinipullorum]|uniref:V-type ATP synthase subunit I n=1 Tax=Candidatus Fimiplasma intestinipullorum TaxID=2840825 RepID=A0A9D1L082_9FIRM|nr:V-type ATP synthase subunit I [Candidatus Fimiplasma intestinipullorum]